MGLRISCPSHAPPVAPLSVIRYSFFAVSFYQKGPAHKPGLFISTSISTSAVTAPASSIPDIFRTAVQSLPKNLEIRNSGQIFQRFCSLCGAFRFFSLRNRLQTLKILPVFSLFHKFGQSPTLSAGNAPAFRIYRLMNRLTSTGTDADSTAPLMNEYTAMVLLVACSTIGRQTSIDGEPGSEKHSK